MDVNQLLNRFADAQKMMKQMGGMMGLPGAAGARPPSRPKNKRKGTKGGNRPASAAAGGMPGGLPRRHAAAAAGPGPERAGRRAGPAARLQAARSSTSTSSPSGPTSPSDELASERGRTRDPKIGFVAYDFRGDVRLRRPSRARPNWWADDAGLARSEPINEDFIRDMIDQGVTRPRTTRRQPQRRRWSGGPATAIEPCPTGRPGAPRHPVPARAARRKTSCKNRVHLDVRVGRRRSVDEPSPSGSRPAGPPTLHDGPARSEHLGDARPIPEGNELCLT